MKTICACMLLFFIADCTRAQSSISGTVIDRQSGKPVQGVRISITGSDKAVSSLMDGRFTLSVHIGGEKMLVATALGYYDLRMVLHEVTGILELGAIYLEREVLVAETEPIISLDDTAFGEEGALQTGNSFLQAGRDVFLNRASFDFSQAFFRARGYDSRENRVLLNGFVMNSPLDGRPQWNQWGGLNDITRNQELNYGLSLSDLDFGGLMGTTLIDTRPSGLRPGWRLSASSSNRSYTGRAMATYVSRTDTGRWAYALSASRRWAREGYIRATLYDAWSVFGTLEYRFNGDHSLVFTSILPYNRRGRSSALTEEVAKLAGPRYNPYWGWQNGRIRNSRERIFRQSLFQLNYYYQGEKSGLRLGAAYGNAVLGNSRLGYYNAPNPDPVYYRYLPSYAINNPAGPGFLNARIAEKAFLSSPQLDWGALYRANFAREKAAFLLYDDVVESHHIKFLSVYSGELGPRCWLEAGGRLELLWADNFSRITDLLGAGFHEDTDPFSNTANDVGGPLHKKEGDVFGYRYQVLADMLETHLQLRYSGQNWQANASAQYTRAQYRRIGIFGNGRYPDAPGEIGAPLNFSCPAIKGGLQYHIGGRHWGSVQAAFIKRPPVLEHSYINPRETGDAIPGLSLERVSSIELRYDMRLPSLMGRIAIYHTKITDKSDVNFFFTDTGLGSDFVQEVVTGLDERHEGIELGLEYEVTPNLKASAVVSAGRYLYAGNPEASLYFDTAAKSEELIDETGSIGLGPAFLLGEPLAAGPQTALSFGLEYRAPSYWWIGATANYLGGTYTNPALLARTKIFLTDPETGSEYPQATPELLEEMLRRKPIDPIYLLNLTGGKSWLKNGLYVGVFVSVSNVFNLVFKTGGYEQSRNGNYGQWLADRLSGTPSFGTKYWFGYGRTFFLNLAVGF